MFILFFFLKLYCPVSFRIRDGLQQQQLLGGVGAVGDRNVLHVSALPGDAAEVDPALSPADGGVSRGIHFSGLHCLHDTLK